MEVIFRLPKQLDSAFKSLSTTFEEKVFRSDLLNSSDPENIHLQRGVVRPVVKSGSHDENTTELVIGTLHSEETLKISFSLIKALEEEENGLFSLNIPFIETGAKFLSTNLSNKTLGYSQLLHKASIFTEWNVSVHNIEEFELVKGSSWVKLNKTIDNVTKYTITKDDLEAANDFIVYFKQNNLTENLNTEETVEKVIETITPSLLRRGNFRLLQETNDEASEDAIQKMYGDRVDEYLKKKEVKVEKIEEKREAQKYSDEMLTNIVMGVFVFTIFLYIVSKFLERKYKGENASLQDEAEKVEREYTEKFNKIQNRKNKKIR